MRRTLRTEAHLNPVQAAGRSVSRGHVGRRGPGGAEMSCSCVAGGAWGLRRWSWTAGGWTTTVCWPARPLPPPPSQLFPLTSGSQKRPTLPCSPPRGLLIAAVGQPLSCFWLCRKPERLFLEGGVQIVDLDCSLFLVKEELVETEAVCLPGGIFNVLLSVLTTLSL